MKFKGDFRYFKDFIAAKFWTDVATCQNINHIKMTFCSYWSGNDQWQRQKQERRQEYHDVVPIPPQPSEKSSHDPRDVSDIHSIGESKRKMIIDNTASCRGQFGAVDIYMQ